MPSNNIFHGWNATRFPRSNRQHPFNVEGVKRDIIVIGASAGGVTALSELFAALPQRLPATIGVKFLQENPDELDLLFKELLIGVTNFFRDPEAFKNLQQEALPLVLKGKGRNSTLRVWIPGCSTGEEAYSAAISIAECIDRMKLTGLVKSHQMKS